ncbi:MAG: 50S ribosomal protein L9 [Rickettsiales bacterium]|nr:50S ribosomal protein L9 [Rickettsiales bacterium]
MEVILLESFDKLGKIGDTVNVKDGFARNFLLPKKKALRANDENKKYYEKIKKELNEKNEKLIDDCNKTAVILKKTELIFIRQASDSGQLYGSVSPKDISLHLLDKKIDIKPSSINLTSPIKNIGIFEVVVKLHAEVSVKVRLIVATSEENAIEQKKPIDENKKNNTNDSSKETTNLKSEQREDDKQKNSSEIITFDKNEVREDKSNTD